MVGMLPQMRVRGKSSASKYVHLRSFVVLAVHGEGSSGELLGIESVGADLRSVLA